MIIYADIGHIALMIAFDHDEPYDFLTFYNSQ